MNVRIKRRLAVTSGLVHQGVFSVNNYVIDLDMLTVSDDHQQQNIAYDRIKFWIYHVLQDGILISENSETLPQWASTGSRILALPEEPVDQVVGIMLYLKLNSIMENRIVVTGVEVSSSMGDDTVYVHSHGEGLGPLGHDGWWTDPRPCWILPRSAPEHGKIVTLDRSPEWAEHDLDWNDKDVTKNTVVFADFNRDENK